MFSISLRNARETRRYSISSLSSSGWEVKLEQAVERALALFQLEVSNLTARGWRPIDNTSGAFQDLRI